MKISAVLASYLVSSSMLFGIAYAQDPATGAAPGATTTAPGNAALDPVWQQKLDNIDGMVQQNMDALHVPGYALAVIKDTRVIFKKTYGLASIESNIPVTSDTVFGLASLTKTFTAFTLLSLVDKGLVDLDAPLSRYIKGLKNGYQDLTIRQLASMRAGVPARVNPEVAWQEQMPALQNTPLVSQPDSQFLYSNFSYRLLGSVIASVTGRPYLQVVRETMLGPFNMPSTATTELLANSGRLAQGYGDNMGQGAVRAIAYKSPKVSFSAGMLASTQNDMVNYVLAMMDRPILSAKSYNTLWYDRPPLSGGAPSPWAFGWHSERKPNMDGQLVVAMNGGTPGVASTIIMLPEKKCAVVALCNLRKPPVYSMAKKAAMLAFGNSQVQEMEEDHPGAASD